MVLPILIYPMILGRRASHREGEPTARREQAG